MLFHFLLSLFPLFVSLFWVALLLMSRKNIIPNYYLALILSFSVIPLFTRILYFERQYQLFAWLDHLLIFTSLSAFPLLYYYIRLSTHEQEIDRRWMWMLLPSPILALLSFFLSFAMSPEELNLYTRHILFHEGGIQQPYPMLVQGQIIRMVFCKITVAIQVILSIYFGCKHLIHNRHAKRGTNISREEKNWRRVKWVLWTFCIASTFYLFINSTWYFHFFGTESSLMMDCLVYGMFLSLLGFAGYHPHFTVENLEDSASYTKRKQRQPKPNTVYKPDGISSVHLNKLMEEDELYKNPELRMSDIASMVGTNRTYLSRIVNDEFGSNFCEWVNSFRIEHAKKIMHEEEYGHLSLKEISEMSGFATLGVFYKVFKANEQIPPGDYRKTIPMN